MTEKEIIAKLFNNIAEDYSAENGAEYIIGYDTDDVDGRTCRRDPIMDEERLADDIVVYLEELIDSNSFFEDYLSEDDEFFATHEQELEAWQYGDMSIVEKYNNLAFEVLKTWRYI